MNGAEIAAFAAVAAAAIGGAASIVAAWVANKTHQATKPISNGFAADVTHRLDRIEQKVDRTETLIVDHIEDHAKHDLRLVRRRR